MNEIGQDTIPIEIIEAKNDRNQLKKIETFFHNHIGFISWVHIFMMFFFMVILFLPLFLDEPAEKDAPWNNFTLFSNYIMWAIWFPLVFLSVIFTGRSWCGIFCPMGAASEFANKKGFSFSTPKWIKWEGTPVVAFLLITIIGQTIGVRDHKEAIAMLFGGLTLTAIIIGYFFGKNGRVWCRHMCPVGLLLGLYSRLSIVNFHPKVLKSGGEKYREKSICPTMIDILRKQESRHCIECFRCVDPESKKSVAVSSRHAGSEVEDIIHHNPNGTEVAFFFIGTGAALGGFLWLILPIYQSFRQWFGEFVVEHGWYWFGESGPHWLMSVHPERREVFNWIDFSTIVIFILSVTLIFALILYSINWIASYIVKQNLKNDIKLPVFNILAYQYMPIAMVALVVGLGGKIFTLLEDIGLSKLSVEMIKTALFLIGILWSWRIGQRILHNLGLSLKQQLLPLFIGGLGSLITALTWWPAIFGV